MTKRNPKGPDGPYDDQGFCAEEWLPTYYTSKEDYSEYTAGYGVVITPPPPNQKTITDMVIEDLRGREKVGHKTYGKPLLPHDGRDSMKDLYEELLDAAQYIRKVIEERDNG